jgi:hypothetical protein
MLRFLVTISAAALSASCSPELNWRNWSMAEAGVSLEFPCKPVRQQRTVTLAAEPTGLVLQVCDAGDVTWAVSYARLQDPAGVGQALVDMASAASANLGAVPGSLAAQVVRGATPNPHAGRIQLAGRAPDGRALAMSSLLFAKGTWVVQVTALGGRLPAKAVENFLGSVRAGD